MENLAFGTPNSKPGISRMLRRLGTADGLFVVCEATGGYERCLVDTLHGAGVSVCRANAARVRAFAASEGVRAKTDPIDAGVILAFAKEKELRRPFRRNRGGRSSPPTSTAGTTSRRWRPERKTASRTRRKRYMR